jgi:hypothetical protein
MGMRTYLLGEKGDTEVTTASYMRWWRARHPDYDRKKCRLYRLRRRRQQRKKE